MKPFFRLAALSAAALFLLGADQPAPRANWSAMVAPTAGGGHLVGNPHAGVKLVEYVSYTCSHCAEFEVESSGEIAIGLLKDGKGSVEYRSLIRNGIDMAATLMVNCGPVAKFQGNHSAILRAQEKWFVLPSPAQEKRWASGPFASRMRAIAADLRLYGLFEARGYSRVELDRCLANEVLGRQLAQATDSAGKNLGIHGTPSFLINGQLQYVNDWHGLRILLMAATR